jgi:transcriptional regulator with XRE-family HTH domain
MSKQKEKEEVLLGQRIRALRTIKGWTQQELGNQADVNYKFIGEIERGQQNPSFNILVKISNALGVDIFELFRFEQETFNRNEIEKRIQSILKKLSDDTLRNILLLLNALYPIR